MKTQVDNISKSNQSERSLFKWNGFYRALVIESKDPLKRGRIKVRIPDLMPEVGDKYCGEWEKNGLWAQSANNFLGGRNFQDANGKRANFTDANFQGSCIIPVKGSWVFIFFENGDPNHPYYFAAGEFGQTKVLPENQTGEEWDKKWTVFKSPKGRCLVISDDESDCRFEITGKKRLLDNPPDGDINSVFQIEGNQTVLLLDERDGNERFMFKDHKGNFITAHINDETPNELHIYFKGDIHMETLKDFYIKTGGDMHIDNDGDFYHNAKNISRKSIEDTNEQALNFKRNSVLSDRRYSGVEIEDKATSIKRKANLEIQDSAIDITRIANHDIKDFAVNKLFRQGKYEESAFLMSKISTTGTLSLETQSVLFLKAQTIFEQGGSVSSETQTPPTIDETDPINIQSSKIANPVSDRNINPTNIAVNIEPILPNSNMEPLETIKVENREKEDSYETIVGGMPKVQKSKKETLNEKIIKNKNKKMIIPKKSSSNVTEVEEIPNYNIGIDYTHTLLLEDQYRTKIIPLLYKSKMKYLSFTIFRDPLTTVNNYNCDSSYFDSSSIPVYDNYRNPDSWTIDDTTKWWQNLDQICNQAKSYGIKLIITLFDFFASPEDPFINLLDGTPYTYNNWSNDYQGLMVSNVMDHIKSTGVDYILNLGHKAYTLGETNLYKMKPDTIYLKSLISYLIGVCHIPSKRISLTSDTSNNLFVKNPYCTYKFYTDNTISNNYEISLDTVDDNQNISTYENRIKLYADKGICLLSGFKMTNNIGLIPSGCDEANYMNYIFAYNQRLALKSCMKETDDIFIDFT